MGWVLVGYFPKRRAARAGWVSPYPDHPDAPFPAPAPVEEICSVSNCIARGPDSREEGRVPYNDFGGYDSPASAWRAVAAEQRCGFDVYACRLLPALFREGREEPLDVPAVEVAPLPGDFECLGYDAVELACGALAGLLAAVVRRTGGAGRGEPVLPGRHGARGGRTGPRVLRLQARAGAVLRGRGLEASERLPRVCCRTRQLTDGGLEPR